MRDQKHDVSDFLRPKAPQSRAKKPTADEQGGLRPMFWQLAVEVDRREQRDAEVKARLRDMFGPGAR